KDPGGTALPSTSGISTTARPLRLPAVCCADDAASRASALRFALRVLRLRKYARRVQLAKLFEIVENFFLVHLRLADDAIGEDVRHFDRFPVMRLRDHFEPDLETDRIEFDAFERFTFDQKIAACDVLDRRERLREH